MEQTTEGLADHAQDMALHHPLDRQPWDGITEQDDTVWFDIACWGRTGSRCLREAVKGVRNHSSQAELTGTCRTLRREREPEDQRVGSFSSSQKHHPITG